MAQYIEIKDGEIKGHYCASKVPEGDQYKEVSNFQGFVGLRADALNDDGTMKSQEELISLGLVKDSRGSYWSIETKQKIIIKDVGVSVPDGFTDKEPGQFDDWNESEWVENAEKKKEYEDMVKVSEAQAYLNSTDYKVIKAMEQRVSLDELYEGETEKREAARQIIRDLSE